MPVKKFNAVTETMLYKCHSICKYHKEIANALQENVSSPHTDGSARVMYFSSR